MMENIRTCCLTRTTDQHMNKLTQQQHAIEVANVTSADHCKRNAQARAGERTGSRNQTWLVPWHKAASWATQTANDHDNVATPGRKLLRTLRLPQHSTAIETETATSPTSRSRCRISLHGAHPPRRAVPSVTEL
jgi:hypothetical protein